jgi:opacity protein-like surface antigen
MEVRLFRTNLRPQPNRAVRIASALIKSAAERGGSLFLFSLLLPALAGLTLIAPPAARAQAQAPATSDLFYHGFASVGCFKFAGGATDSLDYYGGIEYDRHNLGSHLSKFGHIMNYPGRLTHSRFDLAMEINPIVLLHEPALADQWGNPLTTQKKTLVGVGLSPLGLRMMWRDGKRVMPYWGGKTGGVVFNEKALAPNATYANFSFQIGVGTQIKMTEKTNLRAGFQLYHFSNLYVNGSNPGLDTLGFTFGFVRHLRAGGKW